MNLPADASRQHASASTASLFYRPYELGGRDQKTDNKVFRGLVGLQGNAFGWDYDTGLLYIKSKLKNTNTGFIIYDAMQAALNNGTYRINRPSLTPRA